MSNRSNLFVEVGFLLFYSVLMLPIILCVSLRAFQLAYSCVSVQCIVSVYMYAVAGSHVARGVTLWVTECVGLGSECLVQQTMTASA